MKIDANKPVSQPNAANGPARARAGQGGAGPVASPSAGPQASTATTLSGAQNVEGVLASTPVVNAERVAEIKRAIAEGRFQVNPERIADGLLKSVQDMLTTDR